MKKNNFEQICDAVQHGEDKTVEHTITHKKAKVLACRGTNFEVEITEEEHQNWAMQNCEENP